MTLMDRLRDDVKGCPFPRVYSNCQEAATALDEALAIARELARLATNMGGNPIGSVGTQVAKLEALEERLAREREFDALIAAHNEDAK